MFIDYKLGSKVHSFKQVSKRDLQYLNFLLTNSRGDFLNLGVLSNSCKYQGFCVCKTSTVEIFKFIDEIMPVGLDIMKIEYSGDKVVRHFESSFSKEVDLTYSEDESLDGSSDVEETASTSDFFNVDSATPRDSFFVGPTGGLIYEINNFDGQVLIDLDMRKKNDFDKSERDYRIYNVGEVIMVEFTKVRGEYSYTQFLGVKAQNFAYDKIEKFVKKKYSYSRIGKSDWSWSVYRFLDVRILNNKKMFFGCGFSEQEVLDEIELLEKHEVQVKGVVSSEALGVVDDSSAVEFEKPVTSSGRVAYELSNFAMHKFLKTDLSNSLVGVGCFGGFPFFTNIWSRDDIFALRAFINMGEIGLVKSRIDFYLKNLDSEDSGIRNLLSREMNSSFDILFLLAKRIEDFLFYLIENDKLMKVYSKKELNSIYYILNAAFSKVVKHNWDFDMELIKVVNTSGFRDGVVSKFPLNVQILFLSYCSFMSFLGKVCSKSDKDVENFLDFEELLRLKIRSSYVKSGNLVAGIKSDKVTYDVFSSYYFYPELFSSEEWEGIFDRALIGLKNGWSGISSLSSEHSDFIEEHSGDDRKSRNLGDSFFYMNNLAAICLNDLNEKKYRDVISKILATSVNDVLMYGTLGFSSELSSSVEQRAEGNLAHLTSSSSFIEMFDKLFVRK